MLHTIMDWNRTLPELLEAFAIGFAIGSIPFGLLLAWLMGLGDLRKIGSGNICATNVLRTGNKLAAALTMLLDMAKGLVPTVLFLAIEGDLSGQAAGAGAVLGHCLTPWLWFRGGKGVATFIGVMIGLYWLAAVLVCATWLAAAALSRMSSVGAIASVLSAPLWLYILGRPEAVLCAAALAVWVILRHHSNIRRIIAGTEPRIGQKNANPPI